MASVVTSRPRVRRPLSARKLRYLVLVGSPDSAPTSVDDPLDSTHGWSTALEGEVQIGDFGTPEEAVDFARNANEVFLATGLAKEKWAIVVVDPAYPA